MDHEPHRGTCVSLFGACRMMRIDVIGELDEVCIDMLAQTLSRTTGCGGSIVNLDALDITWPEAMTRLGSLLRAARAAGRPCSLSVTNRRVRSMLVRGGCADLLIDDVTETGAALGRRVIIARHLANDGPKRPRRAVK